jgi:eukaryotic-like serine/threonine-protein kinase
MPTTSQHLAGTGSGLILPGEVLAGKYRVERILGAGGWGVVVAARNLELEQRVAIKLLAHEQTPEGRARMLREARAAARIHSDHVVQVFDVGCTETETPYIVMEYLEGQDLASLLLRSGAVPVTVAVHWVLQACEGVASAQRQGIVHRDLKPANLFLERRPDGSTRLKLLDFGIAKVVDSAGITESGAFMGSPAYMAPEQLLDPRDVDARTDVWGLGVVLYELLTAQRPFAAESPVALIKKVREQPHPPLSSISRDVPEALSRVVDRCLAKPREARWSGVAPLARALAPFAPAHAEELIASIERVSTGREDQLTLDSSDPRSVSNLASANTERASGDEQDLEPSGLAATLARPRVLRSRLLLAALLLVVALALTALLRQPGVMLAPSATVRASTASAAPAPPTVPEAAAPVATGAAAPRSTEARIEQTPEPAPATPPVPEPPRKSRRARPAANVARPGSTDDASPIATPPHDPHAPAPASRAPSLPHDSAPESSSQDATKGPLPIDRSGPWEE